MDLASLISHVRWVRSPADLELDSTPHPGAWEGGSPGNATASWLVWGHLGGATRGSQLLTADTSESPMKGGKATAQRNKCRVIKNGIKLSTEDFKYLSQKKDGLIIYYSIINYPQTFIISQMTWVRDSRAKLF